MPFDNALWSDEWEARNMRTRVHLTFTGCLGPCAVGNNALLQIFGRSIWFKDLNSVELVPLVFDYIDAMLVTGRVLPVPTALLGHVYERYLTPADLPPVMSFGVSEPVDPIEALEGLDPVCLMQVEVETSAHVAVHGGRTFAFCADSCKRAFLADPARYLGAQPASVPGD